MNYHQIAAILLALSCTGSNVLAGLLPSGGAGGSGYQYNRPNNFGDISGSRGGRPQTSYGPPGSDSAVSRPTNAYIPPQQFGDNTPGYQGGNQGYQGGNQGYQGGNQGYQGGNQGYQGGYQGGNQGGYQNGRDGGRPQPYSFQYEVYDPPSGNDYSQRESSDGNVVQGEYRVLLPDSRTQIVKYMADDVNGYTADVQYEGQAQFSRGGAGGAGGYPQGGPGGYQQGGAGGYQQGGAGGYQQGGAGGYQQGGAGGYQQGGAGGYQQGGAGGYQGGRGSFGGNAGSNQYLPPGSSYRK